MARYDNFGRSNNSSSFAWFKFRYLILIVVALLFIWLIIHNETTASSLQNHYAGNYSLSDISNLFKTKETQVIAQVGSLVRKESEDTRNHMTNRMHNLENQMDELVARDDSLNEKLQTLFTSVRELLALSSSNVDDLIKNLQQTIEGQKQQEKMCFDIKDCPKTQCDPEDCDCPISESVPPITIPEDPHGIFYIVAGAESSGNRYTVSLLKSIGCSCVTGHVQPWDYKGSQFSRIDKRKLEKEKPRCAAIHRSFPHGGQWVNLRSLMNEVVDAGYEPRIIYIIRNSMAVAESQVKRKMASSVQSALMNISRAKREIYGYISSSHVWFREFSYEQYASPKYMAYVYKQLGYKGPGEIPPEHREFKDMNAKYNLGT